MTTYKCEICGNVVEKHVNGGGQLVCCDQPMKELPELNGEEGLEKHKPVIEKVEGGISVNVGSVDHPMTEEHSIKYIQVIDKGVTYTKYLKPNQKPHADFVGEFSDDVKAREYCNLHGLWTN